MALGLLPIRTIAPPRPSYVSQLATTPLARDLGLYIHVNGPPGPTSGAVASQAMRNLVPDRSTVTYSVGPTIAPAPSAFGGYALLTTSGSLTISGIAPTFDLSRTGPGYTLSGWGYYHVINGALQSTTMMAVTDGTAPATIVLKTSNSAPSNANQGTNRTNTASGGIPRAEKWMLVTFTSNGTTGILYRDGIEIGRVAETVDPGTACNSIQLGSNTGSSSYFCDFAIWRRALSPAEVYSLYEPRTRWNLLVNPSRRIPFTPTVPPVVSFLPRLAVLGSG